MILISIRIDAYPFLCYCQKAILPMEKNLVMEQHGPETIKYDNAHKALQKMCIANYPDESLQTNGSKNIHRVNLAEGNRIENALMFYQHKIRAKKFDLF